MTQREELFMSYMDQIKALGYRVFVNNSKWTTKTYCTIADDKGRIGYCQLWDYGVGVTFSTQHKPGEGIGCGFGITDPWHPVLEITREHVEESFAFAPEWVTSWDLKKVKKWTLDEYLKTREGKDYIEYEA